MDKLLDIISVVSSVVMLIGVIFGIYFFLRKPQDSLEKKQIIAGEELKDKATILQQKEAENKANILAEQIKARNEENERRFADFGKRLDDAFTLAANHTHTVDVKVDSLIASTNAWHLEISNKMTELSTMLKYLKPKE